MYTPRAFRPHDAEQMHAHMRANGFGVLVTGDDRHGLWATHLPLSVRQRSPDAAGPTDLVIAGHLAKANRQGEWIARNPNREVLAIFPGPHAYISPSSYDARNSVPTWDYTAIHAYGYATLMGEPDRLLEQLAELIAQYEPAYQTQWNGLSDEYRNGMLGGITGFEIRVTRIEGSFKLSQNKTPAERVRIAEALRRSPQRDGSAVADLILAAGLE